MNILYDSKSEEYKKPFGCLKKGEKCTVAVKIPRSCTVIEMYLCIKSDDEKILNTFKMDFFDLVDGYDCYNVDFTLSECGLYFYYFKVITAHEEFELYKCGFDEVGINCGDKWQLSCYDKEFETPEDFKGKVMYQIFPDRFYKYGDTDISDKIPPFYIHENWSDTPEYRPNHEGIILNNDFFGGNLKGIEKKLDYIKDLGVGVIYLNPVFMAFSNHRYDTADYKRIDPLLGDEKDFCSLCKKAHELNIKIILDGVFSHTGSESIYFDKLNRFGGGAYHNQNSPYRSWYQFDGNNKDGYVSWWGINTLPCVNELDENYLDYIIENDDSVVAHWLNLGADGFRLDVADELPDEFIHRLRKKVKQINKDALIIGEVWEDASNKISYGVRRKYFTNMELDCTMNYPYKDAIIAYVKGEITHLKLADTVMTIAENYPKPALDCLMNSLSTHDTMRILTVLGNENRGLTRDEKAYFTLSEDLLNKALPKLKLAMFLQFVLPGCPCIYYGDEIGMQGFEDPFNRRAFDWEKTDSELREFVKNLAKIKLSSPALKTGDVKSLDSTNALILTRKNKNSVATIIANASEAEYTFKYNKKSEELILLNGKDSGDTITLSKYGFALILKDKKSKQERTF